MNEDSLFHSGDDGYPVAIGYNLKHSKLIQTVRLGYRQFSSTIDCDEVGSSRDLKGEWWKALSRGSVPHAQEQQKRPFRTVDLFCGLGGLGLGIRNLCADLGLTVRTELIVDEDKDAAAVYAANHEVRLRHVDSVEALLDFRLRGKGVHANFAYAPEIVDSRIADTAYEADLIIAGPPCQGNSNFNNHTRYNDARNSLYLTVPAFAIASHARMAIIENVPGVVRDRSQVVAVAQRLFELNGYQVEEGFLNAGDLGWPQTRRRHFLVARRGTRPIQHEMIEKALSDPQPRSVWWAIHDLENLQDHEDPMDRVASLHTENQRRIDWLYDNSSHDLPLSERPESHQQGTSYRSVYSRMHADAPAPTITTGFLTPGRGRFVHPTQRRTLTPREAARLQGFPDTYRFVVDRRRPPSKAKLARWIGNAVPMPLGYAAGLAAIGRDLEPFMQ